jgi:hypothetical protein
MKDGERFMSLTLGPSPGVGRGREQSLREREGRVHAVWKWIMERDPALDPSPTACGTSRSMKDWESERQGSFPKKLTGRSLAGMATK